MSQLCLWAGFSAAPKAHQSHVAICLFGLSPCGTVPDSSVFSLVAALLEKRCRFPCRWSHILDLRIQSSQTTRGGLRCGAVYHLVFSACSCYHRITRAGPARSGSTSEGRDAIAVLLGPSSLITQGASCCLRASLPVTQRLIPFKKLKHDQGARCFSALSVIKFRHIFH